MKHRGRQSWKLGRRLLAVAFWLGTSAARADALDDSLLWLEEVEGERALAWVEQQNQSTLAQHSADPRFQQYRQQALEILDATDRIAAGTIMGPYLYNFWRDQQQIRGIWRRSRLDAYIRGEPEWETLLDLDALAETERQPWVYQGADCLAPEYRRCLLRLSPGGTDASVHREFDTAQKAFVEEGFVVPLAKSNVDWLDSDSLLIATDWGAGSMNDSGYPRILKRWRRGTPLSAAETVLEGGVEETFIFPQGFYRPEGGATFIRRAPSFFVATYYVLEDSVLEDSILEDSVLEDGALDSQSPPRHLPLPGKVEIEGLFQRQVIIKLNESWRGYKAGALLSFDLDGFLVNDRIDALQLLYDPGATGAIRSVNISRDALYVTALVDVSTALKEYRFVAGRWQDKDIDFGANDVVSLLASHPTGNDVLLMRSGFLTPESLYHADFVAGGQPKLVQASPHRFDASGLIVEKKSATSRDGTAIPYFVVRRADAKMDGTTPVLQYGYGGFALPMLPGYNAVLGKLWLEQGGAYVNANIRGGSEYGPAWHEAALLENRQRAYEDFYAVAEAVQRSGLSSPAHYGATGRSNGGLLMGVALTQRPELWNAIVIGVPLLDMRRYNKLLAGASWMGEYGNPDDPEQWDYIRRYSPFHNLQRERNYPEVLFYTSTKDDRVHPGHARKMAAKMAAFGHAFAYYENTVGGHAGSSDNAQRAMLDALIYLFLQRKLALPEPGIRTN